MKKSNWTATHYGECQLCGHTQKLPGGGLLSLHGYEVRWNSFQGTCPGSRELPYEKSCDLLHGEINRQRGIIASLQRFASEVAAEKNNIWVFERIPAKNFGGNSTTLWRELTPDQCKIVEDKYSDWSAFHVEWMSKQRGDEQPKLLKEDLGYGKYAKSKADLIKSLNAKKVASINHDVKQHAEYAAWLKDRITSWKLQELRPIPVEEQGTKVTLHALNAYWSQKTGRKEALCGSGSSSFSGRNSYKQIASDNAKVNCKACLKALASIAADALVKEQAQKLVAEMTAKYGNVMERWSDAAKNAVKEIRYQRKEIDKAVRQAACNIIER